MQKKSKNVKEKQEGKNSFDNTHNEQKKQKN